MKRINKYLKYTFLILCFGIWIFFVLKNTYYNKLLKEKGICVKAKVFNIYRTGRKGTMNIEYEFKIDNVIYRSSSMGSENVGDTILVRYLPNDPTINRTSDILGIDCYND